MNINSGVRLIFLFAMTCVLCSELGPGFLFLEIPILLWWSGILGRLRVWNSSNIQAGAEVVSITPKAYRLPIPHYDVKVEFSDESWCRTAVATNHRTTHRWGRYETTYSVSNRAVIDAVERAVQKHDRAALKQRG